MTLAAFFELNKSGNNASLVASKEPPMYVFDNTLLDAAPGLKDDLEWPRMFSKLAPSDSQQIIMGPEASGAPMHFHVEAFNAALVGRKRWFLVPPANNFWSRKPAATWFADNYSSAPKPMFECVQGPGDIIYIPEGYGHAVLNLEETVAVASEMGLHRQAAAPRQGESRP